MAFPSTSMTNSRDARELAVLAPARRDFYRFLSASFLDGPSPETMRPLVDTAFQEAVAESFSAGALEQVKALAAAMAAEDFWPAARREYTQLFLAPGGQYIPPYESVFRDKREVEGKKIAGLLMGPSAVAVQQWYRLAALEIRSDFKELPDHLGLEFHYLGFLCERERTFGEEGDSAHQTRAREMERDFLKAHVLTWLPELVDQIQARAQLPLYPAIGSLAVEFCHGDLALLEAVVGPSSGCPLPAYAR